MPKCRECGIIYFEAIPYDPEDPDSVARLEQIHQLVREHKCPVADCGIRLMRAPPGGGNATIIRDPVLRIPVINVR